MLPNLSYVKRCWLCLMAAILLVLTALSIRLFYLVTVKAKQYVPIAQDVWQRERTIKAARGQIYDRNGEVLATNESVCTISVIHNQITDPERVIKVLCTELGLSEETVRRRVEKYSSIERIKANVDKEIADRIKEYRLDGVMVDEDYRRIYPVGTIAARVIGFTGADNQGIIGLEAYYDELLSGTAGKILTATTSHGLIIDRMAELRREPVRGLDLYTTLDYNIQLYCQQAATDALATTGAKTVSVVIMNPQNGELLAMTTVPEFDANAPFEPVPSLLVTRDETGAERELSFETMDSAARQELLNRMWRNPLLSDTYEPGSTFKIVTSAAAFEAGVLKVSDRFYCPGHLTVSDRVIHCHKRTGHGSEDFREGIMNSCNPVFMQIAERTGVEQTYRMYERLGLFRKTGVDLPGEANSIMHRMEAVGPVELATMSFGQSFQITPLQLMVAVSGVINGGTLVTPHVARAVWNPETSCLTELAFSQTKGCLSEETSETMKELLEAVVSEGTGKRGAVAGYHIGGKTATSQKLPRSAGKYLASFIGFAPAEHPEVLVLVLIDEPVGIYYGGTIAAPVASDIFHNILEYLEIEGETEESQ